VGRRVLGEAVGLDKPWLAPGNCLDHPAGELLRGQAAHREDLVPAAVVEELLRQREVAQRNVHASVAELLGDG
jgi:hypothetical protein